MSPQTTRPCLASTTSFRSGLSRTASPTCLDEREARAGCTGSRRPRRRSTRARARSPSRVPASTLIAVGVRVVDVRRPGRTRAAASRSTRAAPPGRAGSARGRRPCPRRSSRRARSAAAPRRGAARVKCSRPHRREVAARALDPHRRATSRPAWSVAVPLADVLPPPKFDDRAVGAEQVRGEHELAERVVRHVASAGQQVLDGVDRSGSRCSSASAPCSGLLVRRPSARRSRTRGAPRPGPRRAPSADARLGAQRPDVGAVGVEQDLVAAEHVAAPPGPRAAPSRSTSSAFA